VARELAMALHAELTAIEVLDVPMYLLYSGRSREGMPAQDPMKAATNQIAALGGFEPRIKVGYGDEQLIGASSTLDLLVMGSRSVGLVRRLLHGSTNQDLVRGAHCAVLLLAEVARAAQHSDSRAGRRVATVA
jgi:nucleotide-binding universal stress UspA family protein